MSDHPVLRTFLQALRRKGAYSDVATPDGTELVALFKASGSKLLGYAAVSTMVGFGVTAGTVSASKALVPDASKDLTGLRNQSNTGLLTSTGGLAAAGGYSVLGQTMHTGGNPPSVSTDMSDYTVVVTETIRCQIFVPATFSSTGLALFNGSAVAGNVTAYLITAAGAQVTGVLTASTALSGTDAYQRIPWSGGPYTIVGPATYWIAVQGNNTGGKVNCHTIGNFGADKQTGTVYGTLTVAAAPTTFATAVGPVASLY